MKEALSQRHEYLQWCNECMGQSEMVHCNTYREDILLRFVRFKFICFQFKFTNVLNILLYVRYHPLVREKAGGMETNLKLRKSSFLEFSMSNKKKSTRQIENSLK